jgi:cell division protein FtsQ
MPSRTRAQTRGETSPDTVTDASAVRSRKRFARRQWARRWLTWKPVLAVLLVIGLVAGGVWLFYFSSVLAVVDVEVSRTRTLDAAHVREVAAVPSGEPLATVDLDAVRVRVEALAVVRSADVTRQWPDRVLIEVQERVAVAVVDIGGRLRGMDADGVVFGDYATAPPGLPQVRTSAETPSEALAEAAHVVEALPETLSRKVAHVEAASVDQISLVLRDGRTVVWGSAEESDQKARVLGPLLGVEAETYDVSVPRQPTTAQR